MWPLAQLKAVRRDTPGGGRTLARIDDIVAALTNFFAERDDVAVAYLFGSTARGQRLSRSDIDIGLLFADGHKVDRQERVFRCIEIAHALEDRLGVPVDVVDLRLSSPVFNHHVLRSKIILKGHDASERVAFEKAVRREYFDMLPYHKRYVDASLQRLREGGGSGGRRGHSEATLEAARGIHQRFGEREGH